MEQVILLRKYQQAMRQLQEATDAVFQYAAELEAARARIEELETQAKEKKEEVDADQDTN